ncbi:alpha/beta fold hydrolase [Agromyces binzhouensis]|uniref:alpha/beta fold hydrolase n=1 Tax=Agromyces binzhouensis TaxID=1817495 RepID=UPI00363241AB
MAANGWPEPAAPWHGEIRFCRAPDGTRLAFRVSGAGPPLVTVGAFASHLELDHQHPVLSAVLGSLHQEFTVLRYDERGHGLSECDLGDDDLVTRVRDLESVVDAAGLGHFAIFAAHMGGPVGIAFSALHPERVTQLILMSTFARGPALLHRSVRETFLFAKLIQEGWGRQSRSRRVLSTGILPGASDAALAWLDDAQPLLGSKDALAASYWNQSTADATGYLDRVVTPTLVIHAHDDLLVEFAEARRVAEVIPNARLVSFADGGNVMPEHSSNWQAAVQDIASLVSEQPGPDPSILASLAELTPREVQILQFLSSGRSNAQIAAGESLSVRTVERHVSNIYRKLHLTGPTSRTRAAVMYVRQRGTTHSIR